MLARKTCARGAIFSFYPFDKGTEYLANFNAKTRQSPVDLLRTFITSTAKALTPRFLRELTLGQ